MRIFKAMKEEKLKRELIDSLYFTAKEERETIVKDRKIGDNWRGEGKLEKRTHVYETTGAVYEGTWIGGLRHGQGKITYPDNAVYTGQWSYNHPGPHGQMVFPDGRVYEGGWYCG